MQERKRILIIDDEEMIVKSLSELLTLSGFEVESFTQAKEILASVKSFMPHLILLDLLMPHMGGLEICEILNGDKLTQGIPIIVVSALEKEADIKKAYHLGVVGYITKPYDFAKLLQEINKVIGYKEDKPF